MAQASSRIVVVGRLLVPLIALVAWGLVARLTPLVPSVWSTARAIVDGVSDGWLLDGLWHSLHAMGIGYAMAVAIGVPLGVLIGGSRFAGATFEPVINAIFAVPRIVIYPVLLVIFGVTMSAEGTLVTISAVFPILLSTMAGVRAVNPTLVKVGRSFDASPATIVRKIYLPAALPSLMTGLRLGFSIAFVSVIIGEMFAATEGLGTLISRNYAFQELPEMYAVVSVVFIIALLGNLLLWRLEQHIGAETE